MQRFILTCSITMLLPTGPALPSETTSFSKEVAPILLDNCLACHGAKKAEGGYRVDNYDELLAPGDSGETPVVPGEGETSELLRRIVSEDESERMPAESEPLTAEQIALVKNWIAGGAKFDGQSRDDPLSLVIPAPRYADPPASYASPVPIAATSFSPDGNQLLVGGYHELTIWDVSSAKLVRRIKNIGQRVFSIAFDSGGKTIAVGCGEPGRTGELRLVDFQSGEVRDVIARSNDVVLDAAFRPGSNQLAVASADSLIRIFDVETLEELRVIASHADWVTAIAWSDDGSRLVSASRDKSAKVFDGQSGELLASYLGHGAAVRGVSILADGKQVVSTGADNKLHRWQIDGAKRTAEIALGGEAFKLVRGKDFVLVPCTDQQLLRIDLNTNKVSQAYQGHSDWVLAATLQSSGSLLASGAFNGEVRIWNGNDGSLTQSWLAKP